MPAFQGTFDANQFAPRQIGESHPVGKFPFTISNTSCEATKDQTGGMFIVEFTTPVGTIPMRYNLWNQSEKAKEIAHGQLSALCHATGIYRLDFANEGAAMRAGIGMIEVGYQKGQEPTPEKPHGGYTEVKRVYDKHGNEPGKAPSNAPAMVAPQQPSQPMTQQANGGWGGTAPAPQNNAPAVNSAPSGWSQNAAPAPAGNKPPWAS